MIIKIQYSHTTGRMKITSKPTESGIGDTNIVKIAPKCIIDQLDGRSKAYFLAINTHGELKIYCEHKPFIEW